MAIFETLIRFLKEDFSLNLDDEQLVRRLFLVEKVQKHQILVDAGCVCHHIYFVEEGLLRTYHTNANGTEFTRLIAAENQFCTVLISFLERTPSPATVQALENSTLLKISAEKFRTFIQQSANAQIIYTKILETFQNLQIGRLEFLTQFSPQEKVEMFLQQNAELSQRLTNKVIASYLQITRETYSRCKKIAQS